MSEEYKKHFFAVFGGYLRNKEEVLTCTSGGIATALAKRMIELNGFVAGVAYTNDFHAAEYIIIDKLEEISRLKGSKYIEVKKNNILMRTRMLLDEGKNVLFFGLPCMIAALKKYLGHEYETLLTCELICHGPTRSEVHEQYINWLEKKYKSKIVEFSVRHKEKKWLPGYLYAKFENGKIFMENFYMTEYGFAFSVMGRDSCYACKYKGDNSQGDLLIGDFWGAEENDPYWNLEGISSIFVHTEKGMKFLENVLDIQIYETTFEKAIKNNSGVIRPKGVSKEREKFLKLFEKYGLIIAARKCSYRRKKIFFEIYKHVPEKGKNVGRKIKKLIKR